MEKNLRRRILVITYYWPPSGGVGVQRWLKFVKYLRLYGWEPVVYTPENPESFYDDESLLNDIPEGVEVIKTRIWEPYKIYKRITGTKNEKIAVGFTSSSNKKKGLLHRVAVWLRGNLLIPDPRVFWVNPSVKFLKKYLRENPVDVVVTTGPPHSIHLIGLKLKQKMKVKWLADFRDPWTNIDYIKDLRLSAPAMRIHRRLESKVVKEANRVVVVSEQMKREFQQLAAKRIDVITNGFDEDDTPTKLIPLDEKFSITHVGTLTPSRNTPMLWQSLADLCVEIDGFRNDLIIRLVGQVDISIIESIRSVGLDGNLESLGQVTHAEAMMFQKKSQVLLLVVNNSPNATGIITGKVFEYFASGRMVLAVGPTYGDLASLLSETKAGFFVDYNDKAKTKRVITHLYNLYKENNLRPETKDILRYSRKELTRTLSNLLNEMTNE
ncbi:MAG TPA: glycosyltransferase family 4 protein [Tenuifilaceae bacterium]|nr:glycosyltransferase family 4 protein [Tenuifilaceae bacterium]